MPPKWASAISKTLGYFILMFSGIMYITQLLKEPLERVSSIAISSFGIIAALSGICYALIPCLEKESDKVAPLYAGEKFLHSALLIMQTLFLKYAIDKLLAIELIKSLDWANKIINGLASFLLTGIGGYAVYFAVFGFDELNKFFWQRYEKRIVDSSKSKKN
jgi:hypothetical protein